MPIRNKSILCLITAVWSVVTLPDAVRYLHRCKTGNMLLVVESPETVALKA